MKQQIDMKRNILMVAFATAMLLVGCGTKEKTPAPIQEYVDSLNAAYERGEDEAILSGSARVEDKTVIITEVNNVTEADWQMVKTMIEYYDMSELNAEVLCKSQDSMVIRFVDAIIENEYNVTSYFLNADGTDTITVTVTADDVRRVREHGWNGGTGDLEELDFTDEELEELLNYDWDYDLDDDDYNY